MRNFKTCSNLELFYSHRSHTRKLETERNMKTVVKPLENVKKTASLYFIRSLLKFVPLRAKVIVALGSPTNKRLLTTAKSFTSGMHVSHLKAILHGVGSDHGTNDGVVNRFLSACHFGRCFCRTRGGGGIDRRDHHVHFLCAE